MEGGEEEPHGNAPLSSTLLMRVGLSLAGSNAELSSRAQREASEAEQRLEELRRRAREQAARCQGQLGVVALEARAEEEKRLISERVERELAGFREEMRRKEAKEEERITQLYRALLAGPEGEAGKAVAQASPPQRPGRVAFPEILYSEVSLMGSPEQQQPSRRATAVATPMGEEALFSGGHHRAPLPSGPRLPQRLAPPPQAQKPRGRHVDRHHWDAMHVEVGDSTSEAQKLLRVNLARLERLERLGF